MTRTIEELIPDYLRGLPVYVPGKPIEEVERELKIHAVKLASNENPLGLRRWRWRRRVRCWEIRIVIRTAGRTYCAQSWRNDGEFRRKRFLLGWGRARLLIWRRGYCCARDGRG